MLIKDGLKHERDFKDRIIKDLEASRDKERKNLRDVMNKLYDLEKEDEKKDHPQMTMKKKGIKIQ